MNPDGTDMTAVTDLGEDIGYVAWSPDGTKLAFSTGTTSSTPTGPISRSSPRRPTSSRTIPAGRRTERASPTSPGHRTPPPARRAIGRSGS
jgi:hypothetical protein